MEINLQEKTLPVILELKEDKGVLIGSIVNSDEIVTLSGKLTSKNEFELYFDTGYAKLIGEYKKSKIIGKWIRTNKDNYELTFSAQKTGQDNLFAKFEKETTLIDLKGKWRVDFEKKDKPGLANFTQTGSRLKGAILTETGDYRYLDGYIKENKAFLYGYDGVFSFVLELVIKDEKFIGSMFAGISHQEKIQGLKDENFSLRNPNEMTVLTSNTPLKLKLNTIDGDLIDISKGEFKNKAKIIQIFGSWCPNCIDETRYFLKWRSENKAKLNDVKFLAVAFERTASKKQALKDLRKLKVKMKLDYPVLLADFDKSKKVTDFFPIDKTRAFPTTLYLDRKNNIIKIHTGFSGQATGEYFEKFTHEFDATISSLIED